MALLAQHSSHVHPGHPLTYHSDDRDYICHGCRTVGFGARFQCQACPVSIHLYCSDCPRELSSFLHTLHRLLLVAPTHLRPNCDLCLEPIDGLSYRCDICDFDVHPLCTQFPEELHHVIDEHHKLRLKWVPYGSCGVCRADCSSRWVYRCDICSVNIHLQCLRRQYDNTKLRTIPHAPSRWTTAQHHQQPNFHGAAAHPHYQLPNFHFWYPGPVSLPPGPQLHGAGGYWPPPPPPPTPPQPPLVWGAPFMNTVFSLIGNLAAGAINEFLFGSISF